MRITDLILITALLTGATTAPAQQETLLLVACAPGYGGSPSQAQPTMDRFAQLVADAAGLPEGRLEAEYRDDETDGVARIRHDAAIVIVPLAFFLKYEVELDLRAIVEAVPLSGEDEEPWTLVAPPGQVHGAADLEGWELLALPGYAPAFVRGPVLADWGTLPEGLTITFSDRILGGLRRVAAGERVAVLLDAEQAGALPSLPFADRVEVVTQSPPMVPALLATVGDTVDGETVEKLREGLLTVHESARFHELLTTLRLSRFAPLDPAALEHLRAAYREAG